MKKGIIVLIVVVLALLLLYGLFKGSYNNMVNREEAVKAQWSNVENQYQRRADLIPNLVNTVKGYASHEENTFREVTEARARATQVQMNFEDITPETLQRFNQAQGELSSALSRLLAVSEAYPDLKANQNFRDLQVQLEGTENRIATERRKFNEMTQQYNIYIKQFPRNLIASLFGFHAKPYFEAEAGASQAPRVEF